jgi:hypothetical protein
VKIKEKIKNKRKKEKKIQSTLNQISVGHFLAAESLLLPPPKKHGHTPTH